MKRIVSLLLIALSVVIAQAQTTTITGTVREATDQSVMPYSTVRLFAPASQKEASVTALSDAEGHFVITTNKQGAARLVVAVIGTKPIEKDIELSGTPIELGDILMQPAEATIGSAVITAARPVVRMEPDKVAYDLQADADTRSSTLLDMLRKVPLVTVDGNDNIQVAGQSNFKIYVDGKPQPMFNGQNAALVMKSIPASYATEIEVITNPGARYDAEGTGGIINIKTIMASGAASGGQQQSLDGYSLNIDARAGNRDQGISSNLTWQRGPFSLNANVGVTHRKSGTSHFDFDRIQHTDAGDIATLLRNTNAVQHNMLRGSLSLSYQIDTLRLLTASGNIMSFRQHNDGTGRVSTAMGDAQLSAYNQRTRERMRYTNLSANLDYQRGFAGCKERFLTLSYQFNHTPLVQRSHNYFDNFEGLVTTLQNRYSDNDAYTTEHTAQADFTTPLVKGHTLSVGAKFIGRINNSDATMYYIDDDIYTPQPDQSTLYRHYNDIGAAYAEYEGTLGSFKLKAGARYEHTWQRVRYEEAPEHNFSLDYGNLVPSATLTYQMAPTRSLGLTYKMRITRPFISALNPYRNTADPTNVTYGNPDLDAEKTNAVGIIYSSFSPAFIVRAQAEASFTNNSIEEYSFYDTQGVLNTTYGNMGSALNAGANVFVNVRPSMSTNIMLNGGAAYVRYHSNALGAENHGWQCNLMVGLQQTLWWKLKLTANLFTMSRTIQLQGTGSGFGGVMGSLNRSFLKDDMLTVGISGFMPLRGTSFHFKNHTSGPTFTNRMSLRIPVATIGLSVTLKLGKMGLKTRSVNRSIENTDGSSENPASSTTGGLSGGAGMGM